MSLRGGAWWELDELAVRQSILRWRRVRVMLGTWGRERLRRKGEFRARIEALLAGWGQAAWGGDEWWLTSESLGVKEPAFLEFSQAVSDASDGRSHAEGSAEAVSAARS